MRSVPGCGRARSHERPKSPWEIRRRQPLEFEGRNTHQWVEQEYNAKFHSGIQMTPLDRFNLDRNRVKFLTDDAISAEVFFVEETRRVSKTNVFSILSKRYECPVDLREKTIAVRFDRMRADRFIVYFDGQRMGEATPLDLHANARLRMPEIATESTGESS